MKLLRARHNPEVPVPIAKRGHRQRKSIALYQKAEFGAMFTLRDLS